MSFLDGHNNAVAILQDASASAYEAARRTRDENPHTESILRWIARDTERAAALSMAARYLAGLLVVLIATACNIGVPAEQFDPQECAEQFEAGLRLQPELPLRVQLDPELPDHLIDATLEAVEWWNAQGLGELFTSVAYVDEEPPGCGWVRIHGHDFTRESQHGRAVWNQCWAEIDVQADLTFDHSVVVIAHELGHAMNVPHDEWEGSLMYRDAEHLVMSQHTECLLRHALEAR